jgi:hypothetical protein
MHIVLHDEWGIKYHGLLELDWSAIFSDIVNQSSGAEISRNRLKQTSKFIHNIPTEIEFPNFTQNTTLAKSQEF